MSFSSKTSKKRSGFENEQMVYVPPAVVKKALKNPLLQPFLPTYIGIFPTARGHERLRPNGCQDHILKWCLGGAGWIKMDGIKTLVTEGDLLLIPARIPHAYGADDQTPWTVIWFHARGPHVSYFWDALGSTHGQRVHRCGTSPQVLEHFLHALDKMQNGFSTTNLIHASRYLEMMLVELVEAKRRVGISTQSHDSNLAILQHVQHLRDTLSLAWTVPKMASSVGLSVQHFSELFKRETGHAPLDYLIQLRMQQACHLLTFTSLPIKEIANQVGYQDPLYFSRKFRQVMGTTATAHREMGS